MKGVCILKAIRVKNVRSLVDTGTVPLSPITLLVGENSSGKSTFLRTFPLIKQSIMKRTDGPLLWTGDLDDFVDFGSFSETVTNNGAKSIAFRFMFSKQCFSFPRFFSIDLAENIWEGLLRNTDSVDYAITISQKEGHEYVSELLVQINNTQFKFVLPTTQWQGKAYVDGKLVLDSTGKKRSNEDVFVENRFEIRPSIFGFALPRLSCIKSDILNMFQGLYTIENQVDVDNEDFYRHIMALRLLALPEFAGICLCKGQDLGNIRDTLKKGLNDSSKEDSSSILSLLISSIDMFMDADSEKREEYYAVLKLIAFYGAFDRIDDYINEYFRQVHYIAPLRATAERYYRLRNLAIDEVDYQGKNLPIFLSGLSRTRLMSFQKWTQDYFGFKVIVDRDGGHLSVKIAFQTETGFNLSDTGFGYSQILPIITQIWDLSTRPKARRRDSAPLVIAIEQPELHLHPALQAKLAEAFIACLKLAKQNRYQLQLILETHSETIVNYFGRAIARGSLQKDDISVILFNRNNNTNYTVVQTTGYSSDGYLENWPIGFFAPKR